MVFKKLRERVDNVETFEKGVCTVLEGYFKTNKETEVRYSMDNAVDKFWHFVKSVDERLKDLERELTEKSCDLELEIQENEKLKEENKKLKTENAEQGATIIGYEQDVEYLKEQLKKRKTATEKGGKQ